MFERVMQGRELDPVVADMPKTWPRRSVDGKELPLVVPTVRAAAADRAGNLWVSFLIPYTYVFDAGRREDSDRAVSCSRHAGADQPVF